MGMHKKSGDDAAQLIVREPLDQDAQWREIFTTLAREIGEAEAWSWFGGCRFVEREAGLLVLAQSSSFTASEGLRRFGRALAQAARVQRIKVFRSGGHLASTKGAARKRSGFEVWP